MSLTTLLIGSALLTAATVGALAFTKWGRRRPLHRYGALSISAHLLLLAGLACVRIGGPPQPGAEDAPPMRVQIVMRTTAPPEPEAKPEAAEPTPPQVEEKPEPAPEPIIAQEEPREPIQERKDEPSEAPEPVLLSDQNPDQAWSGLTEDLKEAPSEGSPTASEPEVAVTEELPPEPVSQPQDTPPSPAPPPTPVERVAESPPAAPEPVAATELVASPLAPSAYNQRGEIARQRLSADQGGTQESLDAVASAIDWLARAQRRDGAWDAVSWQGGRETKTFGHNRRGAGTNAETGLTGLALLAMGGGGHTHLHGPYRDSVTRGLQFLLDSQADNGSLAGDATIYARTYCHSMATFALAEAMAVTGDDQLRPAVTAAANHLVRSQNRAGGGWRYGPGDRGDMSQMGWAVMALRSAELAGVRIDPRAWDGCERFVESVRRGQHGGLAAYQPRGRVSSTMTAEAMYCRQILGQSNPRSIAEAEAVAGLLAERPGTERRTRGRQAANFYYWYYGTLALHHHASSGSEAETAWRRWNEAMQRTLLAKQVGSGPLAGSWSPDTLWGGYGGRVYSTALATMCLEVYYRYNPETIGRDPWLAARDMPIRR